MWKSGKTNTDNVFSDDISFFIGNRTSSVWKRFFLNSPTEEVDKNIKSCKGLKKNKQKKKKGSKIDVK